MKSTLQLKALAACLLGFVALTANATTLWAARGTGITEEGATLVAAIRDDLPAPQSYSEVKEEGSFAFKGIFAGAKQRFQMGINEKGLFVASSTAGSVSLATRRYQMARRFKDAEGHFTSEWIIRHASSVADAIGHLQVFKGYPTNFLLADAKEIALVEVTPSAKVIAVQRISNGVLTETNHYTLNSAKRFNETIGESSQARLAKIRALLKEAEKPYSSTAFLQMTQNDEDGPDLSLFRVGSKPQSPKTLASIVVKLAPGKPAQLSLRYLSNPSYNMTRWKKVEENYPRHK